MSASGEWNLIEAMSWGLFTEDKYFDYNQPRDEKGRWVFREGYAKKKSHKKPRKRGRIKAKLSASEFETVVSAISTDHPEWLPGVRNKMYDFGDYCYCVDIDDYTDFHFQWKVKIVGNEILLAMVKDILKEWNSD